MNYKWLIRRIASVIIAVFVTVVISWALLEYSPYSPANYIMQFINPQDFAQKPGLYASLVQYLNTLRPHGNPFINAVNYIGNILHGNLGVSIVTDVPVAEIIAQALPWTLFIVTTSIIISFFVGIRLGQKLAYIRGSKTDSTSTVSLSILRAVPVYVYAALLVFVLGFIYHVFPTGGAYSIKVTPGLNLPFIINVLYHAFLPIVTLTLVNLVGWILHMRANTISVLGEDFVNFAEISGVKKNIIESKYIGKNAILPLYTSLIIAIGFSFGGSLFVEQTFSYPGVGNLLITAITSNDYPTEMGVFIILIVAVIVGNLIADLTYSFLDPRVKVGEE
ncbi:ABC transporter permease [Sulfolobus sp. A20]|uniref:ABC transporter permease n=1 Tax=Saccharolobus sp. A20 TaxID=1891280 RepID=UPI000845C8E3|nr:ABC transporter permease [Sulfolobus sp. A20]TRM74642.1 ABC transporter permease [Sulfolobus sp. E5]TRM75166.1 ABC transporter permease [Sulfolobus sp. A20-N-F8]TRM75335.1 ABC transporter permease [Sulfolobus sp. B5]TRM82573.1 ABC transporter permease [Sulfolobus sp. A20-N-F6]TRM87297.1 ABC transporter permease [Sulfolobus sp. C3]TRM93623.1 ABC transporter permease [Sulfolobus sp. A20-N-G8]TRM99911.1 ABC transporter permease [Sulfolobus sp. E1]